MGSHFDGIRMSGLGHEIHNHRHHFGGEFCYGMVCTAAEICGNRRSIATDALVLEAKREFSFLTRNLMVVLSSQV
jgi:hypothetical protein